MTQTTLPLGPPPAAPQLVERRRQPTHEMTAARLDRPLGKSVLIDPTLVKPDGVNPRDFGKLDPKACGELVEMIEAVGQQSAVLVRPLPDDPRHKFQLVAGARRLWSVLELVRRGQPLKLKAEVIELDDRAAALAAEAENRGRAAISAHERAIFLRHRLAAYGGQQKAMASDMRIDEGLLSRLLSLADWPDELLDAFGDRRLVTVEDVAALNKYVEDEGTRETLLAKARELAAEQSRLAEINRAFLRRTEVRRRLVEAVAPAATREVVTDEKGGLVLVINRPTRSGVRLFVHEADAARRRRIVAAIKVAVTKASRA